jgi:ATP-dependent Clp protease ATP-binding subunit ClpX
MNLIFSLLGMIWNLLKWFIIGFAAALTPIFLVFFIILLWETIIKRRKIPKKKKIADPKYSKRNLLLLIKKIYIDFPKRLVMDRLSLDPDRFGFYGVHVFAGCQGSGKTMASMHLLKQLKEKYPLVKIRSNINIDFQDGEITDFRDIVSSNNGIYGQIEYIDEMQNWFDCLESKDFPPEMLAEVTQQRKQAKAIIGTSQVFDRLSKPLREQITLLYKPLTIAGCFTIVRVYDVRIDNGGQVDKMKMRRLYCFVHDEELRNCYDTYKKVERITLKGFQSRANQLRNIQQDQSIIVTDRKGRVKS